MKEKSHVHERIKRENPDVEAVRFEPSLQKYAVWSKGRSGRKYLTYVSERPLTERDADTVAQGSLKNLKGSFKDWYGNTIANDRPGGPDDPRKRIITPLHEMLDGMDMATKVRARRGAFVGFGGLKRL